MQTLAFFRSPMLSGSCNTLGQTWGLSSFHNCQVSTYRGPANILQLILKWHFEKAIIISSWSYSPPQFPRFYPCLNPSFRETHFALPVLHIWTRCCILYKAGLCLRSWHTWKITGMRINRVFASCSWLLGIAFSGNCSSSFHRDSSEGSPDQAKTEFS